MATREELRQQFADLGVEPNDDVLDKCEYSITFKFWIYFQNYIYLLSGF